MLEYIPPTTNLVDSTNQSSKDNATDKVTIKTETGAEIQVSPILAQAIERQRQSENKENQPPSSLVEIGGEIIDDNDPRATETRGVSKTESDKQNSNQGRTPVDVKRTFGTSQSPTSVFNPRR